MLQSMLIKIRRHNMNSLNSLKWLPALRKTRSATLAGAIVLTMLAGGPCFAQKVTEVALSVSTYPATSVSLPYIAGIKLGVFEREGIKVTRISGSGGGGQTVRNVLSGEMSFGDVAVAAAAAAFTKGEKLVVIGGSTRAFSDIYFVSKKGSPVKTIADLRGKAVGYTSPGSASQAILELSLKKAGIDSREVKSRAMGGINESVTALLSGGLDAAVMMEPIYTQNSSPFQIVFRGGDYYPAFQQTVLITKESYLQQNPETVRRFLHAFQKAVDYVYKNPDESAKAWADETGIDLDVAKRVVNQYVKAKQWSVGFDLPAMQSVQESMRVTGVIKPNEKFAWRRLIVQDYLPAGMPVFNIADLEK
jgi:NitT/TauT family transport system substrate-binding protein